MFFEWWRQRRRKQILAQPFPKAWGEILHANVRVTQLLTATQLSRLQQAVQILVAEQRWVGCRGFVVTDEVKVTIAGQMALLLLGNNDYVFERVPSVLIYPHRYMRNRRTESGLELVDQELLGESHAHGSIILSWADALSGGKDPCDGQNLVLHEFAHHLDALDGDPGGSPPFGTAAGLNNWTQSAVVGREHLLQKIERGQPSVLDPYAAESPAEFFAVATESFFERPLEFDGEMPEVFKALLDFYRVDPRLWFVDGRGEALRVSTVSATTLIERRLPMFDEELGEAEGKTLHSADAYFARGLDAYLQENYERALLDLNEVLQRQPDDAEALRYRAEVHRELGDNQTAEQDARRAYAQDPLDQDIQRSLASILVENQQVDEALGLLNQLLKADRNDVISRFYRGVAHLDLGDYWAAIEDFNLVIQRDPGNADAWFQRGECYLSLGLEIEGKRDQRHARHLDPEVDQVG